jgi:hypothetical protein
MSYLDVPRIHFAGKFRAAPSTVNNDPANYSRPPVVIDKIGLGWNPNGNHFWKLLKCTVRSAVGDGGPQPDPLVGAQLESTDQPSASKLVDLDPDQQMVSQVWGLRLRLVASNGDVVEGSFQVVPFNDLWGRAQSGGGMGAMGAFYQSVLEDLTWGRQLKSPLLKRLKAQSPAALSIKFMVDGYQSDSTQPDFTLGRVVGTIGPAGRDEPPNFVVGRLLRPVGQSPLNFAPARVDEARRRVTVDLGNSLPLTTPNGPLVNLGNLQLAILPAPPAPPPTLQPATPEEPQLLGRVGNVAYEKNAGIYELPLTDEQVKLLRSRQLGVVQTQPPAVTQQFLAENSAGAYLDATQYVFRFNPTDRATKVTLVATAFGKPAANQKITLAANVFSNGQLGQSLPGSGPPLQFPAAVKTNSRGRATFTLKPGDPGQPRAPIDGQVYAVNFSWDGAPADYNPDPSRFLSLRIFSGFQVVPSPTWADIEPIFDQYAKLYPFMRGIIDLSDPAAVQQFAARIRAAMSLPESDPRYMPVTRDLSAAKRKTIVNWLRKGAPV